MITLLNANALHIPLADQSVHCCVTSPPYYGLRDYGISGQLGLEPTPEEYIANMVQVFREVWRVLRDDGVLWLNIGDSYAGSSMSGGDQTKRVGGGNKMLQRLNGNAPKWIPPEDCKTKDLMGIPWMLAFALRADGWYLRSDIIWSKPNPMPESVTDRPTKAHEYIFLLTKKARYYYDAEAVKEASVYPDDDRKGRAAVDQKRMPTDDVAGIRPRKQDETGNRTYTGFNERWDNKPGPYPTRNARSVWSIATEPYPGAHFATYPTEIPRRCIKAGCPVDGIVLDPFAGSGTTLQVARELCRSAIGLDLSLSYLRNEARERLGFNALREWTDGAKASPDGYHDLPLFSGESNV